MTCDNLQPLIELLAVGEAAETAEAQAHLTACAQCRAALALARRIENTLAARAVASPPSRFVASVMARVRRERWRAEEQIDRVFNVAIVAAVLLVLAGVWMLFNLSGVEATTRGSARLFAEGLRVVVDRTRSALPTYVAGTALLLTALGVWWWADRRLSA